MNTTSLLGIVVFALDIWALYNIITSGASTLSKIIWCLVVLILPVLGFIAWLIIGPKGGSARRL